MGPQVKQHHHHILPIKTALLIGGSLLFLTVVTVAIAHVDLGPFNFVVAMAVASVKAFLVAAFFMNLKYDRAENGMIFVTSVLFLAIFIVLTGTDMFFRGDVYVKGDFFTEPKGAKSKYKNPWISTPELVARGKELYQMQCVSCHGASGHGDGPAASALNPRPRNFTVTAGWKNGRKATMVFKTLKEGLPPSAMASFASLPADDRWALSHYVGSIGPKPEADSPSDFAKIGIDPASGGGEKEVPTISVELAVARMAVPETEAKAYHTNPGVKASQSVGGQIFQAQCAHCHGDQGKGRIKVKNMGASAFVTTAPFGPQTESLKSQDAFNRRVIQGVPGDIMPGYGNLSSAELKELYQYIRGL